MPKLRKPKKHIPIEAVEKFLKEEVLKDNDKNVEIEEINVAFNKGIGLSKKAVETVEEVLFNLLKKHYGDKKLNKQQFKHSHKVATFKVKETNELLFCIKVQDEIKIIVVPNGSWSL